MAKFFIQKWDKERFPKIYEAHNNKEVFAVFYDKGAIPKIISKELTRENAIKTAKEYARNKLHTNNIKIEFVK